VKDWGGVLDRQYQFSRFHRAMIQTHGHRWLFERNADVRRDRDLELAAMVLTQAAAADTYWVNPEISTLISTASEDFPMEGIFDAPAPSDCGYVEFSQSMAEFFIDTPAFGGVLENAGGPRPIDGFVWIRAGQSIVIVGLCYWRRSESFRAQVESLLSPSVYGSWPDMLGIALSVLRPGEETHTPAWGSIVGSFWAFVHQRIVVPRRDGVGRSEAARAVRHGRPDPPLIRVVELRRRIQHSEAGHGEPVNWQHRWIVNGHWRRQWYPSLDAHRTLWITPYLKGPEDKPLIVKREINAVIR
jgi:hypothetical protein